MSRNEGLQRVFHERSHQGLQVSLLGPCHLLIRNSSPFLLENPLYDVCTLGRVCRWRIEESTVAEYQFNVSIKLIRHRVFARIEVLHHRAKIHRFLDLIKVPADSIELVRANK